MPKQEVEITYEQLFAYINTANRLKPKPDTDAKTKLEYAIDRNRGEVDKAVMEYSALVNDINRDYAATEKNGSEEYLKDNNGQKVFTKENDKNVQDEIKKLKQKTIKIMAYHASAVPKNISSFAIETLQPIAISTSYIIPDDDSNLPDDLLDGNKKEPQRAK